jgi:hypothetical protein
MQTINLNIFEGSPIWFLWILLVLFFVILVCSTYMLCIQLWSFWMEHSIHERTDSFEE